MERRTAGELGYKVTLPIDTSIQRIIPCSSHLQRLREAAGEVPDRLVEEVSVVGDVDRCIGRIEEYLDAGATSISLINRGPDVEATDRALQEKVIPYLKERYAQL